MRDGTDLILPAQALRTFGPFAVNPEVGYVLREGIADGWLYGLAAAYSSPVGGLGLLGELHGVADSGFDDHRVVFNLGFSLAFSEDLDLLFAAGRGVRGSGNGEPELIGYIGLRLSLRRKREESPPGVRGAGRILSRHLLGQPFVRLNRACQTGSRPAGLGHRQPTLCHLDSCGLRPVTATDYPEPSCELGCFGTGYAGSSTESTQSRRNNRCEGARPERVVRSTRSPEKGGVRMYYPNFFEGEARLLEGLRNRVNRAFSDFFAEDAAWAPNGLRARAFPTLNVWEDSDNLYAECELPGVRMDDLEVYVVGSELTIKGERKPTEFEGATYHRRERETGSFSRIVHLPVHVDAGKVSAELHDGVLTVKLPKAAEAKPRKIQVQAISK